MYLKPENRFHLNADFLRDMEKRPDVFDGDLLAELCYYRTYSRKVTEAKNERWVDTVRRCIEGVMWIRKNHYANNTIRWKEDYWQNVAQSAFKSMFAMEWAPPGRGLWTMGTDFVAERGAMCLYNCAYTNLTNDKFQQDIGWMMDCLMLGVGVGFGPLNGVLELALNTKERTLLAKHCYSGLPYVIPDSREGWIEAVVLQIIASFYGETVTYDASQVRPKGMPIKGFGGTASGPEPLLVFLSQIKEEIRKHMCGQTTVVELKTNIANMCGVCVVAGNVRRSAELGLADINDEVFRDLKDYDLYPHRKPYGWMSNNALTLSHNHDFENLSWVAERVPVRGEPGLANLINFKYGRLNDKRKRERIRKDRAIGLNPCGEITLEHREVCNLAETYPTRCLDSNGKFERGRWERAAKFATLYCSTVSLLPTHDESTNAVVSRNRRIGVSIVDWCNWVSDTSLNRVITAMNAGYKHVRRANKMFNAEAGVPQAIKVTTIKPGGTTPKLAQRVSGIGSPTFNTLVRRVTVDKIHPIFNLLVQANVPYTELEYDKNSVTFELPAKQRGTPADQTSLWEQALRLITVQRHWADNAVSNTLYFRPKWKLTVVEEEPELWFDVLEQYNLPGNQDTVVNGYESETMKAEVREVFGKKGLYIYLFDPTHEEGIIERVLAHIAPHIKSCSLLPHSPKGAYKNMPEEGISEAEYQERVKAIKPVDWTTYCGSDGLDEKYCTGDICERTPS